MGTRQQTDSTFSPWIHGLKFHEQAASGRLSDSVDDITIQKTYMQTNCKPTVVLLRSKTQCKSQKPRIYNSSRCTKQVVDFNRRLTRGQVSCASDRMHRMLTDVLRIRANAVRSETYVYMARTVRQPSTF